MYKSAEVCIQGPVQATADRLLLVIRDLTDKRHHPGLGGTSGALTCELRKRCTRSGERISEPPNRRRNKRQLI